MEINRPETVLTTLSQGIMKHIFQWRDAFSLSDFSQIDDTIMPIQEVFSTLNMYYVNQHPSWVTFEFMSSKGKIEEIARQVKVLSPIVDPEEVHLLDIESGQPLTLQLQHIISVAATTE